MTENTWATQPLRLQHLAQSASYRACPEDKLRAIRPYTREDLAAELVLFSIDAEAQRKRRQVIEPKMKDSLIVASLGRVANEWITERVRYGVAERLQDEGFAHRLTKEEVEEEADAALVTRLEKIDEEVGADLFGDEADDYRGDMRAKMEAEAYAAHGEAVAAVTKVGAKLPSEGRDFIESVLGNPDADPAKKRVLDRAIVELTKTPGREDRALILLKKYVQKKTLNAAEREMLRTVTEELVGCLNKVLGVDPQSGHVGPGRRKAISNAQSRWATEGVWANEDGINADPDFAPVGRQETLTYDEYISRLNAGRPTNWPESTPEHEYVTSRQIGRRI